MEPNCLMHYPQNMFRNTGYKAQDIRLVM